MCFPRTQDPGRVYACQSNSQHQKMLAVLRRCSNACSRPYVANHAPRVHGVGVQQGGQAQRTRVQQRALSSSLAGGICSVQARQCWKFSEHAGGWPHTCKCLGHFPETACGEASMGVEGHTLRKDRAHMRKPWLGQLATTQPQRCDHAHARGRTCDRHAPRDTLSRARRADRPTTNTHAQSGRDASQQMAA